MMYRFPNYDQLIFICYKIKKLYVIKFSQRFDVLCTYLCVRHDIHTLLQSKPFIIYVYIYNIHIHINIQLRVPIKYIILVPLDWVSSEILSIR